MHEFAKEHQRITNRASGLTFTDIFDILRKKRRKEEKPPEYLYSTDNLRNEFHVQPQDLMQSYPIGAEDNPIRTLGLKEIMSAEKFVSEELSYLTATQDLETGTPYTDLLEQYIWRMLEGEKYQGNIRVCILRRGEGIQAFVLPDGTICISQSLINKAGSLSAVLAILAHELGHLINGSSFVEEHRRSTEWLHENLGSDPETPRLLDKVGVNTMAAQKVFEMLAEKTENARNDLGHHSALMRSTADLAQHTFINRKHSNADFIPLDEAPYKNPETGQTEILNFQREILGPTNKEMVRLWIEGKVKGSLAEILHALHSRDLSDVITNMRYEDGKSPVHTRFQQELAKFLRERLTNSGVSAVDQDCLLLSMWWRSTWIDFAFVDRSHEDFLAAIRNNAQISTDRWNEMNEFLFGEYGIQNGWRNKHTSLYGRQAENLSEIRDQIVSRLEKGEILAEDLFLKIIAAAMEDAKGGGNERKRSIEDYFFPQIIAAYIFVTFYRKGKFDVLAMEPMLTKLHALGYKPEPDLGDWLFYKVRDSNTTKDEDKNAQKARNLVDTEAAPVFEKVFGVSILRETVKNQERGFMTVDELRAKLEKLTDEHDGHTFYARFMNIYNSVQADINLYRNHYAEKMNGAEFFIPLFEELRRAVEAFDLSDLNFDRKVENASRNIRPMYVSDTTNGKVNPQALRMRLLAHCFQLEVNYGEFKRIPRPETYIADQSQEFDLRFGSMYEEFSDEDVFWNTGNFLKWFGSYSTDAIQVGEVLAHSSIIAEFEKRIQQKYPLDSFQNIQLAWKETSRFFNKISKYVVSGDDFLPIFSSKIESVLMNRLFAEKTIQLFEKTHNAEDFPLIIDFLEKTVSGATNNFDVSPVLRSKVKKLRVAYLVSAESRPDLLRSRMDYFVDQYQHFSYQDLQLLMKQVRSYEDAAYFLELLGQERIATLNGEKSGEKMDIIAMGDGLASIFKDKKLILKTVDTSLEAKAEHTTLFAEKWLTDFFEQAEKAQGSGVSFNKETQRIEIDRMKEKEQFATVRDVVDRLNDLSEGHKKLLALRLLLDADGLLSSEENRVWTADLVLKAFNISHDFVRNIVKGLIIKGRPTLVGLALAELLGPLLFKSLDLASIDYEQIGDRYFYESRYERVKRLAFRGKRKNNIGIDFRHLPELFELSKREIVDTRQLLEHSDNTPRVRDMYTLTLQQMTDMYDAIDQMADTYQPEQEKKEKSEKQDDALPPQAEALIKALESLGGIFVRGLQIGRLVYPFKPALARRLSNAFDRMQATDEFKLWLNLHESVKESRRLYPDGSTVDHLPFHRFFEDMVESVEDFKGGGSLASTYRAKLRPEAAVLYGFDEVALKMLTANVDAFVDLGSETATAGLDYAEEHGDFQSKLYAQLAKVVLRVSKVWCKEDIRDTAEDRAQILRDAIHRFGNENGDRIITATPVYATPDNHIRVEQFLSGDTLNKYLQDPEVDAYLQTHEVPFDRYDFEEWLSTQDFPSPLIPEALRSMHRTHQLMDKFVQQPVAVGEDEYILPQDPHPGNFLVGAGAETLGAIDLPANFTFTGRQLEVFSILQDGDYVRFLNEFIDLTVEYNQGLIDAVDVSEDEKPKAITAARLKLLISKEFGKEFLRHTFTGAKGEANYVQRVLGVFVKEEQKIPWQWFVQIRNIMFMNKERGRESIKVKPMQMFLERLRIRKSA
jgi:hypothetical protein